MIKYKILGVGKPLLLIHGFGIGYNIWKKLNPLLSKKYKLILIELPGIDNSPIPEIKENYYEVCINEIEELRKRLKINSWSILSYSIGTRIADIYTKTFPKKVNKVIFLFPLFVGKRKSSVMKNLITLDSKNPRIGNWILSGWRLKLLILTIGFNGKQDKEVDRWYKQISSQPLVTLRRSLYDLPEFGVSKFANHKVPFLYIWGRDDLVPATPRNHPCDIFIDSGHNGIITKYEEISDAVSNFID